MSQKTTQADQNWEKFHKEKLQHNFPRWPNEVMLKLAYGRYLENPMTIKEGMKVLDIGCGFGNNLLPFLESGCACYGTEVTEETAALAQRLAEERGYSCNIVHGYNQKLPYDDNTFDLLLSINVIHYEKTREDIDASFQEYCRVLKDDGAMILITVGPEHLIYKKAKPIGAHQFEIRDFDFRNGENYYYFDNTKYLGAHLEPYFSDIETGRVTESLMARPLDFLVAVARNKKA